MSFWNRRWGKRCYLESYKESVRRSLGEQFGSSRKWIHLVRVKLLSGKQHGNSGRAEGGPAALRDAFWSGANRDVKASRSGEGSCCRRSPPDLMYVPRAPPHCCKDRLPPPSRVVAMQRVLVEWSLPFNWQWSVLFCTITGFCVGHISQALSCKWAWVITGCCLTTFSGLLLALIKGIFSVYAQTRVLTRFVVEIS